MQLTSPYLFDVYLPRLGDLHVKAGASIEVDDEVGAGLLLVGWFEKSDDRPTDGTVAEWLDWVNDDPSRAAEASVAEHARTHPRKSLIDALEGITTPSTGEEEA